MMRCDDEELRSVDGKEEDAIASLEVRSRGERMMTRDIQPAN